MSKVTKIPILLVDDSVPKGYTVINIAGPATLSNIHPFDADSVRRRIQETPDSGGYVPDAIYQVDEPNHPRQLGLMMSKIIRQEIAPFSGHLDQQFLRDVKPRRIYFVAYPKASPPTSTPTAVKRKPSDEASRDSAKKACTARTVDVDATRPAVKLSPVKIEIEGYADNPIYIVGDDKGKLELSAPPSSIQQCLDPIPGRRYLFSDSSMIIPKLLDSCGDSTLGVYTPVPSDYDVACAASMLVAYVDIEQEPEFLETLGKLAVGRYAAAPLSYLPSKDFVLDLDFANFAVDSLTSATLEKSLNDYLYTCVADFILKYDKHLHFGPPSEFLQSTEMNGQSALAKVLGHIKKRLRGLGASRVIVLVRGYDAVRNLAEVKSLTASESPTNPSQFPSPERVTDIFKVYFYQTVFQYLDDSCTISKLFVFGRSPAFSAELRPCAYTDLTATKGLVGVAGITADQVKVYLSLAVGDKSVIGIDRLARILCELLPGYTYAPDTPRQYPRALLHRLLPSLSSEQLCAANPNEIIRACRPVAYKVAPPYMHLAVKTMYIRGKHVWKPHIDDLLVHKRVPMSRNWDRFRHRYLDFKADLSDESSYTKTVFVPNQPDPFFAYCLDAGYLTVRFAEGGEEDTDTFQYAFPGGAVYTAFFTGIIHVVDISALAMRPPFDGSPEWIFNAMDPYLKNSRNTRSNANAPETTYQSIRTSIMHTAEAHTGADTYDTVMEAEMKWKRRADSIVLVPESNATIIVEDKAIRLFDLIEGTLGTEFDRWPDTKTVKESALDEEDWRLAEVFATHLRELDPSVFTEARFPNVIPKDSDVPFRTVDNLPKKLEEFFFMGWVGDVYGRWSIFELWSSAEKQGQRYELPLHYGPGRVTDVRFTTRECGPGEKNFITVIVVIVLGGVRVLAHRSRLTTNKRCKYRLEYTGQNPP